MIVLNQFKACILKSGLSSITQEKRTDSMGDLILSLTIIRKRIFVGAAVATPPLNAEFCRGREYDSRPNSSFHGRFVFPLIGGKSRCKR